MPRSAASCLICWQHLETVHFRHRDIADDQGRCRFARGAQPFAAVAGDPHAVAVRRQQLRQELRLSGAVFDHQDVDLLLGD
jgi:hypothetical protein